MTKVPGVLSATPTAEGQVMAVAGDKVRGCVLRGVRPEDFKARTPLSAAIEGPAELRDRYRSLCRAEDDKPIDWGSLKDFGDDFSVVIGRRLADLLKLKVGDSLQLVSPGRVATPLGVMPRSAQAKVAAIFCAGMYDYDANFVYAPLPDAQRLLNFGDKVTGIEVFVADDGLGRRRRAGSCRRSSARRAGCSTGGRPIPASSPRSRARPTSCSSS